MSADSIMQIYETTVNITSVNMKKKHLPPPSVTVIAFADGSEQGEYQPIQIHAPNISVHP